MGGCATKPKGDDLDSASPAPLSTKEDSVTVVEEKEIGDVKGVKEEPKVEAADDKGKKSGGDDKVDEQEIKPRSLGHFLEENEEGKVSTEEDKTIQTEEVLQDPLKDKVEQQEQKTENATNASSTTAAPETEKAKNPVEELPTPVVAVATETVETKKSTEPASASETVKLENSDKKKIEEVKGSTIEDAKVTVESQNIDLRQVEPVLPVNSSAMVSGKAEETK